MENTDFQIGMNVKSLQNPYNFAHEYSGWMNCWSFKAILGCRYNKSRHSSCHG